MKATQYILYISLLLLPWQTRFIFDVLEISGESSEYGALSLYAVEVLVVLAFALRGRPMHHLASKRIIKALYFFLAIGFFSLTFSSFSGVGWFHLLHVFSAVMLFSLVLDERMNLKWMISAFAIGLIGPVLLGVYQTIQGSSGDSTLLGLAAKHVDTSGVAVVETASGRMLRAYGSFPHPNIFGGYLSVALVLLAWLARYIRHRRDLVLLCIPIIVLSASLIMTFSRGAWLGLIAGGLFLIWQMFWNRKMPPSRAMPLITFGLLTMLITLGVFHNQVVARFDTSLRVEAISVEERASQYMTFNDVFFSSPILGAGPGAYTFALEQLDPGNPSWSYQPVHNTLLLIMAELGIIGFFFGVRWVYLMDKQTYSLKRNAHTMFALSVGLTLLVIAFFDHYLWSLWPGLALSAFTLGIISRWSLPKEETT